MEKTVLGIHSDLNLGSGAGRGARTLSRGSYFMEGKFLAIPVSMKDSYDVEDAPAAIDFEIVNVNADYGGIDISALRQMIVEHSSAVHAKTDLMTFSHPVLVNCQTADKDSKVGTIVINTGVDGQVARIIGTGDKFSFIAFPMRFSSEKKIITVNSSGVISQQEVTFKPKVLHPGVTPATIDFSGSNVSSISVTSLGWYANEKDLLEKGLSLTDPLTMLDMLL